MTKLMDDLGPRQFDDVSREVPNDMEWEQAVDEEQGSPQFVPQPPPVRVRGQTICARVSWPFAASTASTTRRSGHGDAG